MTGTSKQLPNPPQGGGGGGVTNAKLPRRDRREWSPEKFSKIFALTSVLSREPLFQPPPRGGVRGLERPPPPPQTFFPPPQALLL